MNNEFKPFTETDRKEMQLSRSYFDSSSSSISSNASQRSRQEINRPQGGLVESALDHLVWKQRNNGVGIDEDASGSSEVPHVVANGRPGQRQQDNYYVCVSESNSTSDEFPSTPRGSVGGGGGGGGGAGRRSGSEKGGGEAPAGSASDAPAKEMPSIGSALHALGTCKPCNFLKTVVGCRQGEACTFCHLSHRRGTVSRPSLGKRQRYKSLVAREAASMSIASGSAAQPQLAAEHESNQEGDRGEQKKTEPPPRIGRQIMQL